MNPALRPSSPAAKLPHRDGLAPISPSAPDAPLLDIAKLGFSRGSGDQCFRVELGRLQLAPGEVLAITGESGCGKSTVLELIGVVARPAPGARLRLTVDDHTHDLADLWQRNAHDRLAAVRAAALGFVLQTGGLLPYLTVQDNIRINRRLLHLPDADDELDAIIEALKLRDFLHKHPSQLSIGQQQRAAIARALAHQPALLLADEPTSALDPRLGDQVMALMFGLATRLRIGVILATHEHAMVRAHGLRALSAEPLADGLGSRFDESRT